jgi:hypothetical protein
MRTRHLLVVLGVAAATASCSFSASTGGSVSGDKIASVVSSQLAKEVGQKPDSVTCPNDLKAEKGATTRCALTANGKKYGVTVTATSVSNGHVHFGIKVDNKAQ